MTLDTAALAAALRSHLETSGLSLRAFAAASGIPRTTLNAVLKGEWAEPRLGTVSAIAAALSVPALAFYRLEGGDGPS